MKLKLSQYLHIPNDEVTVTLKWGKFDVSQSMWNIPVFRMNNL